MLANKFKGYPWVIRQYKYFQVLFFHSFRKEARVPILTLLHKSEQPQRHGEAMVFIISILYSQIYSHAPEWSMILQKDQESGA